MSALYPKRDHHFTKATERRLQDDSRTHVYGSRLNSVLVQHSYPEMLNCSSNNNNNNNSNNHNYHHHSQSNKNEHKWTAIGIHKYQIIKKVGSGTYGSVFHAKSPHGNNDVAIKQLSPMQNEKSLQDGFHITAIREIKILKSLHHTNIISLYDVICDKENIMETRDSINSSSSSKKDKANRNIPQRMQTYMIFEYMHHDLSGLLHNEAFTKSFNITHIKYFLCQILNALEYCHETALILHRDIKSSNLLVDNHGVVKIADFGLARQFIPELTTGNKRIATEHESINRNNIQYPRKYTNRVVTLWYRAPELLLSDQHYTPSVDLWSVGCVFAELLFNKPIFQGKNEMEQWFQIIDICGWDHKQEQRWIHHLKDKDGLIQAMKKKSKTFNRKLKKKFSQFTKKDAKNDKYLDENGFQLLDSLLTINPFNRCSAKKARLNEWFKTAPFPSPPQLNHIQPSHDYEQRQARKNPNYNKNQQQNNNYHNNNYQNNNYQNNNPRRYQYSYGSYNNNNNNNNHPTNNNYSNNNNNRYNGYNTNNKYNNYQNHNNTNNYRRNISNNNNNNNRSRSRSRSRERKTSNNGNKHQLNKPITDDRSRSGSFDKIKKDNSVSLPPPIPFKQSIHAPTAGAKQANGKIVVQLMAPTTSLTRNSNNNMMMKSNINNGYNNNNNNNIQNNNRNNNNGYNKPYVKNNNYDPNEQHTYYSKYKRADELRGRSRF